jgi:hypothetical protein
MIECGVSRAKQAQKAPSLRETPHSIMNHVVGHPASRPVRRPAPPQHQHDHANGFLTVQNIPNSDRLWPPLKVAQTTFCGHLRLHFEGRRPSKNAQFCDIRTSSTTVRLPRLTHLTNGTHRVSIRSPIYPHSPHLAAALTAS